MLSLFNTPHEFNLAMQAEVWQGWLRKTRLKNFNLWLLVLVGAAAARGATPQQQLPVYPDRRNQHHSGSRGDHVVSLEYDLEGRSSLDQSRLGKAHRSARQRRRNEALHWQYNASASHASRILSSLSMEPSPRL